VQLAPFHLVALFDELHFFELVMTYKISTDRDFTKPFNVLLQIYKFIILIFRWPAKFQVYILLCSGEKRKEKFLCTYLGAKFGGVDRGCTCHEVQQLLLSYKSKAIQQKKRAKQDCTAAI